MLTYLTAGESHGKYLTGILDGFPCGVKVPNAFIKKQLFRRRTAPGRSARQLKEDDNFLITSGVKSSVTTGAPISILIKNAVNVFPKESSICRPCHADFGGLIKYGITDATMIRERASARETMMRVALFSFPLYLCKLLNINISTNVLQLHGQNISSEKEVKKIIDEARNLKQSIGGLFSVNISGLCAGLGSYSQAGQRLSAKMSYALSSINSVKGVYCGNTDLHKLFGSEMIGNAQMTGGIDGGISNGKDILFTCAVKPVPGIKQEMPAYDFVLKKITGAFSDTSDITSVFAAAVIAEGVAAYEIVNAILNKYGGDSFNEILGRVKK